MQITEDRYQQLASLRVLIVASNSPVRQEIISGLRQQKAKIAQAKSNAEAFEILNDANFLEFDFDGLILNEQLVDGPSWRFVEKFRETHPEKTIVFISSNPDLTLQIWSRAYGVRLVAESEPDEALRAINGHEGVPPGGKTVAAFGEFVS
jgi:DNA-binding response OmpR family regulator